MVAVVDALIDLAVEIEIWVLRLDRLPFFVAEAVSFPAFALPSKFGRSDFARLGGFFGLGVKPAAGVQDLATIGQAVFGDDRVQAPIGAQEGGHLSAGGRDAPRTEWLHPLDRHLSDPGGLVKLPFRKAGDRFVG